MEILFIDLFKMDSLVENLLEYLATTPREQQLKDWESISSYGEFGPDVFEYFGLCPRKKS